jgi:hypothetical protein
MGVATSHLLVGVVARHHFVRGVVASHPYVGKRWGRETHHFHLVKGRPPFCFLSGSQPPLVIVHKRPIHIVKGVFHLLLKN